MLNREMYEKHALVGPFVCDISWLRSVFVISSRCWIYLNVFPASFEMNLRFVSFHLLMINYINGILIFPLILME